MLHKHPEQVAINIAQPLKVAHGQDNVLLIFLFYIISLTYYFCATSCIKTQTFSPLVLRIVWTEVWQTGETHRV